MELVATLLIAPVIFAVVWWTSIKIIDRHNAYNSFGLAVAIGVAMTLFGSFLGLFLALIPLIGLMMLLVRYYRLGLLQSLGVIVVMGVQNFLIEKALIFLITHDETTGTALWGWPMALGLVAVAGFLAWYLGRGRLTTPSDDNVRAAHRARTPRPAARPVRAAAAVAASTRPAVAPVHVMASDASSRRPRYLR